MVRSENVNEPFTFARPPPAFGGTVVIQARLEQTKANDRRTAPRRRISLGSNLLATGPLVTIHNLSSTGMLIETVAKLSLFEGIDLDLPEAGNTNAVVVWN